MSLTCTKDSALFDLTITNVGIFFMSAKYAGPVTFCDCKYRPRQSRAHIVISRSRGCYFHLARFSQGKIDQLRALCFEGGRNSDPSQRARHLPGPLEE
jgi:hypothetical protein